MIIIKINNLKIKNVINYEEKLFYSCNKGNESQCS